jgi:hypothetical protein
MFFASKILYLQEKGMFLCCLSVPLLGPTHGIVIRPNFNTFIYHMELKLITCIGPILHLLCLTYSVPKNVYTQRIKTE